MHPAHRMLNGPVRVGGKIPLRGMIRAPPASRTGHPSVSFKNPSALSHQNRAMNRRTFVTATTVLTAGLAFPLSFARPARAEDLSANQLADQMQKFYDQTRTFQASFKQRYWVEAYRKTKDSNGLVTFAKPGQMSWRYKNNGNRVVSDGKTIKIYEADSKQM